MSCQIIWGQFILLLRFFAVSWLYKRGIFYIPIPLLHIFLGPKSDISGHFGTFLPRIGGFFLNHLPDQYHFHWIYSWSKKWHFRQFWHISSRYGWIFFWMSWQSILRVIYSFPLCFYSQFDLLEGKFWGRHPFLWLFSWFKKWHFRAVLAHFLHILEELFWMG